MAFRDATAVVLETGRTQIRAGLGLHDLLKQPAVEFQARVGFRRSSLTNGTHTNGNTANGVHATSSSRRSTTALPQSAAPGVAVNDYLIGTQLDDALAAGEDILVSWPFADGDIFDWVQAEAIWKYTLFNQLKLRRAQNESPVFLTIAPGLSRDTHERICKTFFERFNVAGLTVLERPMAQLYAANAASGIVVDIGEEMTDITPISDGIIIRNACASTPLGIRDCQIYLANLLRSNQSVISTLFPEGPDADPDAAYATLLDLVKQIWSEGLVKVPSHGETAVVEDDVTDIAAIVVAGKEKAVIESGMKKKATAKASAAEQARAREIEALDLVTIQFREHQLTLGRERHRFTEPLYEPALLRGLMGAQERKEEPLPVQDAVGHAVGHIEIDQRQEIWGGLLVTGDLTRHMRGIGTALQSRLKPFILSNPDVHTDVQVRYIRVLTLPEYFPEYRDTGEGLAAFLGASIVAKITFNDSQGQSYVSKADYTAKGPHAIIEVSPSLL